MLLQVARLQVDFPVSYSVAYTAYVIIRESLCGLAYQNQACLRVLIRFNLRSPQLGSEVLNPDSGLWYGVAVILRSPVCAPGWSKKITEIRKSKFMRPRVGVT